MPPPSPATLGILCALQGELGALVERRVAARTVLGVEILELELDTTRALAVVSGVGKVRAAHAAAALVAAGMDRALLVVGTCGALVRQLAPGDLVHATSALEFSSGTRHDREAIADAHLRAAWREVAPGPEARFFTVDVAVLSPWRRLRLARSRPGPAAVEMETAAAACVAQSAGLPWAALRTVTDRAGFRAGKSFQKHFPAHGGRAADTLPALVRILTSGRQPLGLERGSARKYHSPPAQEPL
ncbi:MAG: hypothetical protein JNL28_07185 [Planctomycetes bacterium]|nr:hypothetical protein [Planctomycetota bacterium]